MFEQVLSSPATFYAVIAYVLVLWLVHWYPERAARRREQLKQAKRREAGLPDEQILNPRRAMEQVASDARRAARFVINGFVWLPLAAFGLVYLFEAFGLIVGEKQKPAETLAFAFMLILAWVLVTATDLVRTFIGGLAFRALAGWEGTVGVGDRVNVHSHVGRVTSIGTFYLTIVTENDDTINVPSATLLTEDIVSINGGDRTSLCEMTFYLHSDVSAEKRQQAEDAIWEAIQASPYYECQKPIRMLLSQESDHILLTAKAFVNVTYDEPVFKSDVTRAFLDYACANEIPLATRVGVGRT